MEVSPARNTLLEQEKLPIELTPAQRDLDFVKFKAQ